jgi:hypothetical protein
VDRGDSSKNIRVVAVVAAPPALRKLSETFPGLKVGGAMHNVTGHSYPLAHSRNLDVNAVLVDALPVGDAAQCLVFGHSTLG